MLKRKCDPLCGIMVIGLAIGSLTLARADVKLPALFGDHMVLQQEAKLPVWGTAAPGEVVTVTLGKESGQSTADSTGKWRVELPPMAPNGEPVSLTVAGKNSITFQDVLIGDVWICSGQSNMAFNLGRCSSAAVDLPKADDAKLRIFKVGIATAIDPLTDVTGTWQVCTPPAATNFSAVGYFFGRELRQTLDRPIGLIGTYVGGTPAQAWTSLAGLKKEPELQHYVEAEEKVRTDFPQATQAYEAAKASYKEALATWKTNGGDAYTTKMKEWNEQVTAAKTAGTTPPPKPTAPATPMPKAPGDPSGGTNSPTTLYNGMVAPLIPFSIKGAIWYQGETNAGGAWEYRTLFRRMITDWRENWNQGDFPFLCVQLASYRAGGVQNWPFLREAQAMALSLPNTGIATAIDVGKVSDIHPTDKYDVGHRLALVAEATVYGKPVVYSGPVYESMKVEGPTIRLSFKQNKSNLIIGQAPWVPPGEQPIPTSKLSGFTIAAADKKWVPAEAKIDGDSVIVSSPAVTQPISVRYDWANAPAGNLYNKEGLPTFPFRTDDWEDPVAMGLPSSVKSASDGTQK